MTIASIAINLLEVSETGEDARSEASEARSEVGLGDIATSKAKSNALLAEDEASEARSEADLVDPAAVSKAKSNALLAEREASEARSEVDLADTILTNVSDTVKDSAILSIPVSEEYRVTDIRRDSAATWIFRYDTESVA